MTIEQYRDQLMQEIQKAIDRFNAAIPGIEKQAYLRVLDLLKDVQVSRGNVISNAENLKKIGQLRGQLENAIINDKLQAELQKFVNSFNVVADIHRKYFSEIDKRPPAEILKEYQKQAKDAVVESLQKQIDVRMIPEVEEILRMNITGGAKYSEMVFRMQEFLIGSNQFEGSWAKLSNLANTLVTEALNNFSAQYSKNLTVQYGFQWRMYVGSNKKTTREWCTWMTKKKYVHNLEIPDVLKGMIDGHQVEILEKTKLWDGAKAGTDANNIDINRGGWKCGHQFLAVPEASVPLQIRIDTYNKYKIPHVDGLATTA